MAKSGRLLRQKPKTHDEIESKEHYEFLQDLLLKNNSLSGGFMKNEDYAPNVARKAVALEIAKNNFDLPYAERDKAARQAEFEFVNATRALMRYEEWAKRQTLEPKVLTAGESWEKQGTKYPGGPAPAYEQGFNHGKPQGRLERDLELRPLIDECIKKASFVEGTCGKYFDVIRGALINLKPLKAECKS